MGSQAGLEFKKAIEKKRIVRFTQAKALVDKELQASQDDLSEAEDRYKNQKFILMSVIVVSFKQVFDPITYKRENNT